MNDQLKQIVAYETAFSKVLTEARRDLLESKTNSILATVFKRFGELIADKIRVDVSSLPQDVYESIKDVIGDSETITTDIFNSLEKTVNTEDDGMNKAISEMLSGKIYSKPKKVNACVKETSAHFGLDEQKIIEAFNNHNKFTPQEFATAILEEGLGDYLQYKGQQIANNIVGKYGVGQSKVIANAKNKTLGDANTILSKWNEISQGNQTAATPQAIQTFLISQFKVNPKVAADAVKKYKPQFALTPASLKKASQNANGIFATTQPNKTSVNSFLPPNNLRNLFKDVVTSQRALVLKPAKPVSSTTAVKPSATTTQPTTPTTPTAATQTKPAQAGKTSATASTADQFAQMIDSLPANQRAQAILKALPSLSDADIKAVLNGLVAKKP